MRRTPFFISTMAFALPLLFASQDASADTRLPGIIHHVDETTADIVEPQGHTSNIIFLNRCTGGCTISPGFNDSRTNHSSIPNSTSYISEFKHTQQDWDDLVSCVKQVYEPFDIVITDQDPGSNVSHFEAIVAGTDDEIGVVAGGIAPGGCGVTNNAITFSFANQGSLSTLCWTVAQETAHAFGLDHEMDCKDPLTYLTSCGYDKTFQDNDAPCGEDANRGCYCGGSTQNSYRLIRDHFGQGSITPPEVTVNRPADGAIVKSNFPFEVAATDNIKVAKVEFFIEGVLVSELTSPPWVINAPDGLSGRIRAEARATDNLGTESTTVGVEVVIDDTLIDFAGDCEQNEDCESNLCAQDAEGKGRCSQFCELQAEASSCPADSSCIAAGDQGVCWADGGSTGGCSTSGASSLLSGLLMLLALAIGRRRFSRSRR